jgi:hypothetical protein
LEQPVGKGTKHLSLMEQRSVSGGKVSVEALMELFIKHYSTNLDASASLVIKRLLKRDYLGEAVMMTIIVVIFVA